MGAAETSDVDIAEGPVPEAGAGGASPTADAPPRPTAPAWRFLDPPALQVAAPMPTTFDAHVERSLAAHLPVPHLAATARPLGHEVRRSAPVGVMGEVMRVVGTDAASLAPAVLGAADDLVLRPLRLPADDAPDPVRGPTFALPPRPMPTASPSPSASVVVRTPDDDPVEVAGPGGGSIATAAASTDAPPAPAEPASPAAPGGPYAGAGTIARSVEAPAPTRVLRTAAEPDAPLLGSLTSSTAPRLATLVARAAAPSAPVDPVGSGGDDSPLPVVSTPPNLAAPLRRRMAVEVRDPSVPVTLDAFRAPAPSATPAAATGGSSGSGASDAAVQRSSEPAQEPAVAVPSAATGGDGSAISSPRVAEFSADGGEPTVQRAADGSADEPTGTTTRPTLGRGVGLGAPMQRLPDSAVSTPPSEDPFAGWDDEPGEPLPLATGDPTTVSRSVDDGAPIGVVASGGPASTGAGSSSDTGSSTAAPADSGPAEGAEAPAAFALAPDALSPVRPILAQRAPLLDEQPEPLAALGVEVAVGPAVVPVAWPAAAVADDPGTAGSIGAPGSAAGTSGGTVRRSVTSAGGSVPGPVASSYGTASGGGASATAADGGSPVTAPGGSVAHAPGGPGGSGAVSSGSLALRQPTVPLASPLPGGAGPAVPLRRLVEPGAVATIDAPGSVADTASWAGPLDTGDGGDVRQALPVAPSVRMVGGGEGAVAVQRVAESPVRSGATTAPTMAPTIGSTSAPFTVEAAATWHDDLRVQRAVELDEMVVEAQVPPGQAAAGQVAAGQVAGQPSAGSAGSANPGDAELDQLAGRLYERIRHRLRRELLDDRERAGISIDRVR